MRTPRVVVIGAGVGGLAAAIDLAAAGLDVAVVERAAAPGGKMREVEVAGVRFDAGPTVFTMRDVFERLFADAGSTLETHLTLRPLDILARHSWGGVDHLDLFADIDRSAEAVAAFSGADEAERFRRFMAQAKRTYDTLEPSFIKAHQPGNPLTLAQRVARRGLGDLRHIDPFATMWQALGKYFRDPRLRQLFGRYATYVGSSPFSAPATLSLIAHAEERGVWSIEGGMHRLADAMAGLAARLGATLRYETEATEIVVAAGRCKAVRLASGERLEADAVVANADAAALAAGRLGGRAAGAVPGVRRSARSLSAMTWNLVAEARGFPLVRHNVFFSSDYAAEFEDLLSRARLPREPTVYVCAQDRLEGQDSELSGVERLFCLVNAPPTGDSHPFDQAEIASCEERMVNLLERSGLRIERRPEATLVTTPRDFERLFPGTGGALYGMRSEGWLASFRRPGARTRLKGLYLAGGSAHPGAGVPMAAISGRLAAASLLADRPSTGRSRRGAISGGMSTR